MKKILKNVTSQIMAMAILCISFSCITNGEATNDNQEHIGSLYNPNTWEKSILFTFLSERLFLESAIDYMKKKGYSCDRCEFKRRFPEIGLPGLEALEAPMYLRPRKLPRHLGELPGGLNGRLFKEDSTGFGQELVENCDSCGLFEGLPYKDLYRRLITKLDTLEKREFAALNEKTANAVEDCSIV